MASLLSVSTMTLGDAALFYAKQGLPVFSCSGKRPCVSGGFKSATNDLNQITQWWQQFPQANIGSPTGANSFVLDIDPPHGEESLALLESQNSPLPETLTQRTGSGGRHLFFIQPADVEIRNSASKIGKGLDIRGTGGYIILPPSVHASGNSYQWINEYSPAEAPAWLVELILDGSASNSQANQPACPIPTEVRERTP